MRICVLIFCSFVTLVINTNLNGQEKVFITLDSLKDTSVKSLYVGLPNRLTIHNLKIKPCYAFFLTNCESIVQVSKKSVILFPLEGKSSAVFSIIDTVSQMKIFDAELSIITFDPFAHSLIIKEKIKKNEFTLDYLLKLKKLEIYYPNSLWKNDKITIINFNITDGIEKRDFKSHGNYFTKEQKDFIRANKDSKSKLFIDEILASSFCYNGKIELVPVIIKK